MVELIGWLVLALGGAYAAGIATVLFAMCLGLGGLERVAPALCAGAAVAAAWLSAEVWLSPLSVGWG